MMMNSMYSRGPGGVIMEGDDLGSDFVSVITDDCHNLSPEKVLSPSHLMHLDLGSPDQHFNVLHHSVASMHSGVGMHHDSVSHFADIMNDSSILPHMDQNSYMTIQPQHLDDVMGHNPIILSDNVNEMVIEQNVEIGSEGDPPPGDVLLVPNNMIKQEDIIEGGEIIVGSTVGNEIVIGDPSNSIDGFILTKEEFDTDHLEATFDDSKLIIDTSRFTPDEAALFGGYDCHICGAVVKTRAALKKHIRVLHSNRIKPVRHKAQNKPQLNGSNSTDDENKMRYCTSCSFSTEKRDKMDKHMQKHVLNEGFHPCGKKRHKPDAMPVRHRHNAEEYHCTLCSYSCTVYKAIKKHQKIHLTDKVDNSNKFSTKISCKICGKDRPSEVDMEKHMKKHRNGEAFHCDVCGFASLQLKKIIQHRRMHTGEKPHLCPHCNYRSARRDNLRSHVRRMHKKANMYIDTFSPNGETSL